MTLREPSPASPATVALQARAHEVIPGGAHTYAKGDDQYPAVAPPFIVRGRGCRVWDRDGNEFIEYGMGLRAVTLGHAHPAVVAAVQAELSNGSNFTRPSPIELEAAEALLRRIPGADMAKFAKNGSDITTAAIKLARAVTGRALVAICQDHPFFSVDDWFIGTTAIDAGIPEATKAETIRFRYNDIAGLEELFDRHPGQIAAVVMEPATSTLPLSGYLEAVRSLCTARGALLVFDEMVAGFRWHNGGAQSKFGVVPDLSAFGKGLANGFSCSALVGKREFMERGGLHHGHPRVFLLSTTHGAETHSLAAAIAVMQVYDSEPVVESMARLGTLLKDAANQASQEAGLQAHFEVIGHPANLFFACRDAEGKPSQGFRTLFMQELIRRGVLGPSFVISYAHTEQDVAETVSAIRGALAVYRQALDRGLAAFLVGPPSKPVYRKYN